jgi:hypothetical protein
MPILEDDRNLREPIAGNRARAAEFRQASQGSLHGEGNPLFDLKRREPRGLGIDLYLDVSDIRDRINRKVAGMINAHQRHHENGQHDEPPVADRALQNSL